MDEQTSIESYYNKDFNCPNCKKPMINKGGCVGGYITYKNLSCEKCNLDMTVLQKNPDFEYEIKAKIKHPAIIR